jgi:hypothetical protein
MYVSLEEEKFTIVKMCELLETKKFHPSDTVVAMVSPDYSATIAMHVAHHLSADGEMLDIIPVPVAYPDEDPEPNRRTFMNVKNPYGLHAFKKYKKVILVEAGIITGNNYKYLTELFKNKTDLEVYTVAQYENVHSVYKSDFVGRYYDSEKQELEFYWERYNKHWIKKPTTKSSE